MSRNGCALPVDVAGKTALVSASTAGIGLAIAAGLAAEHARVIVNGRTSARVDHAVSHLRAKYRARTSWA